MGSGATLCVLGPVGDRRSVSAQESDRGIILEGLVGWIDGGEITVAWDASSPATEELAAGFMLMAGGEGCDGVWLGSAQGPSPLTIAIAATKRPLCAGEVVHLWITARPTASTTPRTTRSTSTRRSTPRGAFLLRPSG